MKTIFITIILVFLCILNFPITGQEKNPIEELRSNNTNVDDKGRTPLHYASMKGELKLVKDLIAKGANLNVVDHTDGTPLHYASKNGHLEIVKFLLQKGSDVNAKDLLSRSTSLYWSSGNGHLEIVKFLIINNADVNAKNRFGGTPLNKASENGRLPIVKLLIEKGADVNIVGEPVGMTSLDLASAGGHLEIVKLLIDKGADVNVEEKEKINPTHEISIEEPFKSMIDPISWTMTPLHFASKNGHLEIVKYLLAKGANKDKKTSDGKTPLDFAKEKNHKKIISILSNGK